VVKTDGIFQKGKDAVIVRVATLRRGVIEPAERLDPINERKVEELELREAYQRKVEAERLRNAYWVELIQGAA